LVWQLHLTAAPWEVLDLACVVAFPLLLLRWARALWWWLLLVAGSWDVWATYSGGNVEAMLLVGALVVARLLWPPRPLGPAAVPLAAVLVAFVVLAKPFYALFFVAFGVVLLLAGGEPRRATLRTLSAVSGLAALLLAGDGLAQRTIDAAGKASSATDRRRSAPCGGLRGPHRAALKPCR